MSSRRTPGSRRGLADMSLDPAERRRRRPKGVPAPPTPPAQLDHGSSPRARKMAAEGEKLMARTRPPRPAPVDRWARFGDAYHQLPRRCWLDEPRTIAEPRYGNWPGTQYEGLVVDLLGRGVPVPDHPSACAVPGCGHAQVWHHHRSRYHACEVEGCACKALVRQESSCRLRAAPVLTADA